MSFAVTAESYDRFMGRFSAPLADRFVERTGIHPDQRALDVGCGPGALTSRLVQRLGTDRVCAVDPSPGFVDAVRARLPGLEVHRATAEHLPFADETFDVTLAQLVVHFMKDPVAGIGEMGRVTRKDGLVAASVWDHEGGTGPLAAFWQAARDVMPGAPDESGLAGTGRGQLTEIFVGAGLRDVQEDRLNVTVAFPTFEDWWEPFTLGVGPAGAYVASLDEPGRSALRERCAELLPDAPFEITASAWCAVGRPVDQA
ncbi:MAG TPA: class I SAM-dependent methyltransferase [Actinomycetales bacterium]|nr:class I SAM-dependent methyltransferase [Actinomycetales bacterium]